MVKHRVDGEVFKVKEVHGNRSRYCLPVIVPVRRRNMAKCLKDLVL